MSGSELQSELLRYGVATITLSSTGSTRDGVRVCVSMIPDEGTFDRLDTFLGRFNADHCV